MVWLIKPYKNKPRSADIGALNKSKVSDVASWWLMPEGSGTVTRDIVGGDDGVISTATWQHKEHGPCLSFTHTNAEKVDVGNHDGNQFAILVRGSLANLTATNNRYLWGRLNAIAWGPQNTGEMMCWINAGSWNPFLSGWFPTPGVIYDFLLTRKGNTLKHHYRPLGGDWIEASSHAGGATAPASNANASTIGHYGGGETWDGELYTVLRFDYGIDNPGNHPLLADPNLYSAFERRVWIPSGGGGPTTTEIPPRLARLEDQFATIMASKLNGVLQ